MPRQKIPNINLNCPINKSVEREVRDDFYKFFAEFRGVFYATENEAANSIYKAGMAVLRPQLREKKLEKSK